MDKVVQKIVALGIPGLILVVAVSTSGLAGGAAIVAALATLGGPLGMIGGLIALGLLALISDALTKYGFDKLFGAVVERLKRDGLSTEEIRIKVNSYPITSELKKKTLENI